MMKRLVLVFSMILLFLGIAVEKAVFFSDESGRSASMKILKEAQAAEPSAKFEWFPNRPGITRAQIALGRATTLRFEFSGVGTSSVKLGIPKKFADMGIIIEPKEVSVKGGKAQSMAIFAVPPGTPLGKFDLIIVAVDAKSGKEIGRGAIQFMLLPAGVGGC